MTENNEFSVVIDRVKERHFIYKISPLIIYNKMSSIFSKFQNWQWDNMSHLRTTFNYTNVSVVIALFIVLRTTPGPTDAVIIIIITINEITDVIIDQIR